MSKPVRIQVVVLEYAGEPIAADHLKAWAERVGIIPHTWLRITPTGDMELAHVHEMAVDGDMAWNALLAEIANHAGRQIDDRGNRNFFPYTKNDGG